jgi:hypothetical protein
LNSRQVELKMFATDRPLFDDEDTLWSSYTLTLGEQIKRCSDNHKPDFLIIAPARTGTTWLAENLRKHPDIYIPPEKEVRFFDIHWRSRDLSWYLDHISGNGAQVSGDASPTYALLPSSVIELIHALNSRLKLIFIMRDPIARAWSHMKHNFTNREANFASSSDTIDRFEDLDITVQLENFVHDYPLSASDYEGALSRWLSYFPRSQLHLTFFDDIYTDPDAYLKNIFRFIGVNERVELPGVPIRQKINSGIDGEPSDVAAELLRILYTPRLRRLDKYVRSNFGLTLPWNAYQHDSVKEAIWLMDKPRGWRIYLYDGYFWAIERATLIDEPALLSLLSHFNEAKQNNIKQSAFLGDLLHELEKTKTVTCESDTERILSQVDRRLISILKHLAGNYDASLQLHASIIGSYKGFNVIRYAGRVYGVRQTIGKVDLTVDDNVLSRLISGNDVLICESVSNVETRIDAIEANRRIHDLEAIQTERLGGVERRVDEKFESLAKRVSAIVPESNDTPRLLKEDYRGFNLISYDGKVWAAAMAAGPVDCSNIETRKQLVAEGRLLEAMTVDGVRAAVDRWHDRQAIEAEMSNLCSHLVAQHAELASRHDAALLQLAQWRDETESRLAGDETVICEYSSGFVYRFKRWIRLLFSVRSSAQEGKNKRLLSKKDPKNS